MPGRLLRRWPGLVAGLLVLSVSTPAAAAAPATPAVPTAASAPVAAGAAPVGGPMVQAWRVTLGEWVTDIDANATGIFAIHGRETTTATSFDPVSGATRWTRSLAGRGNHLVASEGAVFVITAATASFVLTALDESTGAVLWQQTVNAGTPFEPRYLPAQDVLVMVGRREPWLQETAADVVRAFTGRTGVSRWSIELEPTRYGSELAVEQGTVVVANERELRALDPGTGATRWRLTTPPLRRGWGAPLALGGGRVAASRGTAHVYDIATGAELMSAFPNYEGAAATVVDGVAVTIGTGDQTDPLRGHEYGYAGVDAQTSRPLWRRSEAHHSQFVGGLAGRIVMLQNETIRVLGARTGEVEWQATVAAMPYGMYRAAVGAGMIAAAGHTDVVGFRPVPGAVVEVAPGGGPTTGGTTVTVRGHGFLGSTAVRFGTAPATSFTVVDDTTILATAPALPVGAHPVTTVGAGGASGPVGVTRFVAAARPRVDSLVPPVGRPEGGTAVVVRGQGFTRATAVRFGLLPAASFTVVSDTELQATTPPGVLPVQVSVVSDGGTSAANPVARFECVITPAAVEPATTWMVGPDHGGLQATPLTLPLARRWQVTFGTALPRHALVAEGKVFVLAGDALWALDAADGTALWGPIAVPANTSIAYGGGLVVLGTDAGLEALDAESGRRRWSTGDAPGVGSLYVLTIAGGVVYTGDWHGSVAAVDLATGTRLWGSSDGRGSAYVTIGGGVVAYASTVDGMTAVDPATGARRWHYSDWASGGGPSLGETTHYGGGRFWRRRIGGDRNFRTFDPATGAMTETTAESLWASPSAPVFAGGLGVFAFVSGVVGPDGPGFELRGLDLATGAVQWTRAGTGALAGTMVTDGVNVFAATTDGTTRAFALATGAPVWQDAAGAPVGAAGGTHFRALAIGGGLLLVPAGNRLTAYGAPVSVDGVSPRTTLGPLVPVTITGRGFTGATAVTFGGRPAASFRVDSDTTITATAPLGVVGPGDVRVRTAAGSSPITAGDRYGLPLPTSLPALSLAPGNGFLSVTFEPTAGDGALGYLVVARAAGAVVRAQVVAADARSVSLPGLTNDRLHEVTVAAILPIGLGPAVTASGTPSGAAGAARPPDAPATASVVGGAGNLTVRWSVPGFDGGAPITTYSVIVLDGAGRVVRWRNVPVDVRSASVAGLANGQAHTVWVVGWNAAGIGTGATVNGTPTAVRPVAAASAPGFVVAARSGNDVRVDWGPVGDEGGAPITAYSVIAVRGGTVAGWVNAGPDARTAVVPGVASLSGVTMTVVATTAKGYGALAPAVAVPAA